MNHAVLCFPYWFLRWQNKSWKMLFFDPGLQVVNLNQEKNNSLTKMISLKFFMFLIICERMFSPFLFMMPLSLRQLDGHGLFLQVYLFIFLKNAVKSILWEKP